MITEEKENVFMTSETRQSDLRYFTSVEWWKSKAENSTNVTIDL